MLLGYEARGVLVSMAAVRLAAAASRPRAPIRTGTVPPAVAPAAKNPVSEISAKTRKRRMAVVVFMAGYFSRTKTSW